MCIYKDQGRTLHESHHVYFQDKEVPLLCVYMLCRLDHYDLSQRRCTCGILTRLVPLQARKVDLVHLVSTGCHGLVSSHWRADFRLPATSHSSTWTRGGGMEQEDPQSQMHRQKECFDRSMKRACRVCRRVVHRANQKHNPALVLQVVLVLL